MLFPESRLGDRLRDVPAADRGGELPLGGGDRVRSQRFRSLRAQAGHPDPGEVDDQESLLPESVQRKVPEKWKIKFRSGNLRMHAQ